MINKANSVYLYRSNFTIAPFPAVEVWDGQIIEERKTFALKNITFNYEILDVINFVKIPVYTQNLLRVELFITQNVPGLVAVPLVGKPMVPINEPVGSVTFSGSSMCFYEPVNKHFDKFYFSEQLYYSVEITNFDLLNQLFFAFTLSIEIEYLNAL